MITLTDILLDRKKEKTKYFQKPLFWTKIIKKVVKEFLPDARVFLFGSVIEDKATLASDIDVLVTSFQMPKRQEDRAKIKAKIWEKVGLYSPFEIHLVDRKQFLWYKHFTKLAEI
jgi:predicted nucleotidyltransferase